MKVILLPGLDGTGTLFQPLLDALPKNIDTQTISYPPNIKLGWESLTEFVLNQLPEEEFILIAESFSGYIAYQIALQNPDKLQSIIFIASFLESPKPFLLSLSRWLPIKLMLSIPSPSLIIKEFLLGTKASDNIVNLFRQAIKQVPAEIISFRLNEIRRIPKNYPPCETKAIYLQASNDKLVSKSCIDKFKETFTNLNIIQIKGPHFLLQANPLDCMKVIIAEVKH